MTIVAKILLIN